MIYISLKKTKGSYFADENNKIFHNQKLKREKKLYRNEKSLNDYIVELWEDVFRCTWDGEKIELPPCSDQESLNKIYTQFTDVSNLFFSSNAYQAVYVVAYALMDIQSCTSQNSPFQNGSCVQISDFEPWQVRRNCLFIL